MIGNMKKYTLTERQASHVIGVSPDTLRAWRRKGTGPRWFKAGRLCRYRHDWLLEWMDARALGNGHPADNTAVGSELRLALTP
ncbi:MAG: helix-turn-helix domain-containing protein [Bryobacteraceae bacterium]|jgi:hypothetical protein